MPYNAMALTTLYFTWLRQGIEDGSLHRYFISNSVVVYDSLPKCSGCAVWSCGTLVSNPRSKVGDLRLIFKLDQPRNYRYSSSL